MCWFMVASYCTYRAKKQFKVDTYDSIEKTSPLFPRPVCLIGPDSSRIATTLTNVASGRFTLCSTLDETLKVFAKVVCVPDVSP